MSNRAKMGNWFRIKGLFWLCILCSFGSNAQTISTPNLPATICGNATFQVTVNATGTFQIGNLFILEMSDTAGSFSNATPVGFINSLSGGVINAQIPSSTWPTQGMFLFRISSTNPVISSAPSSSVQYWNPVSQNVIPGGNAVLCGSSNLIIFTNPAPFIQWIKNGNPITGANQSTFSVGAAGTYTVRTGLNANCSALSSNSMSVTLGVAPVPNQISGTTQLCPGSWDTLFCVDNAIQWYHNGNAIPGGPKKVAINQPGIYTVKVSKNGACLTVSNPYTVSALPGPHVILQAPPPPHCLGSSLNLQAHGGQSYSWFILDSTHRMPSFSTDSIYTSNLTQSGPFPGSKQRLCVETIGGPFGCRDTACFRTWVGIRPPKPLVNRSGIIFTSSAIAGNQWFNALSGLIPGETAQTYVATQSGGYFTVVSDTLGCKSEPSDTKYFIFTGSSETSLDLNVFPLPAKNILTIKTEEPILMVTLTSVDGKIHPRDAENTVNVSDLSNGAYILEVVTRYGIQRKTILIQH